MVILLSAVLMSLVFLSACTVHADEEADAAAKELADLGLVQVGKNWLVSTERHLRKQFDALDPLMRRHRQAADTARQALLRSRNVRPAGTASSKSGQPPTASGASGASGGADAPAMGDSSPLQEAQIELASARTELVLAVVGLRRSIERMQRDYQSLRERPGIDTLLAKVQAGARLGPAKSYARDPRLAAAATAGLGSPVPIYRESGRTCASLVVNDETPITFQLALEDDATWISSNAAVALGLDEVAQQVPLELQIGKRKMKVRQVELASIRLGRQAIRKVSAYVLPPEAEDLGSRLGAAAFGLAKPRLNETEWVLEVSPQSDKGR